MYLCQGPLTESACAVQVRGFWVSGGETSSDPELKAARIDRVVSLMRQGVMSAEVTCRPLDEWKAVMSSVAAGSKEKFLLTI